MMEQKNLWDVTFMKWERFTTTILKRSGPDWNHLLDANLLIGGVNFTNNFV